MPLSSTAHHLAVVRDAAEPMACRTFRQGLPAARVDASLCREVRELHRAEGSVLLWFSEMSYRRLYADLGYATMQHYATERLGFSANRAYRFEHLAAELQDLPRLRGALAEGEIGWTKVRVLIQVATSKNERSWIGRARRLGRRTLEREVADAKRRAMAAHRPAARQTELVTAIPRRDEAAARPDATTADPAANAPAADPSSEEIAGGGDDASPDTPGVPDAPATIRLRFSSLQLARYEAICEKLRKARVVSSGDTREEIVLQGLESLLADGTADEAPPLARDVTRRSDSEAPAGDSEKGNRAETASQKPVSDELRPRGQRSSPYHIVIYECESCQRARVQTNRGARRLTRSEREASSCDAIIERSGEPRRQTVPPGTKRRVFQRDGHQCRAPGCRRTRYLEVHHIHPWALGGSNRLENLATLCSACHRLWHERGWDIQALRPIGSQARR